MKTTDTRPSSGPSRNRPVALALPSAAEVAKRIDIPLDRWPLNCFAVAQACVEAGVLPGRAVYGMYFGPVAEASPFADKALARHGWIEAAELDGNARLVIDPTRWVFEAAEPYIYHGVSRPVPGDDYDRGMQRLRLGHLADCPKRTHEPVGLSVRGPALARVAQLTGELVEDLDHLQLRWLATLPPLLLGEEARAIQDAIAETGGKAWIPMDFWEMAHEPPLPPVPAAFRAQPVTKGPALKGNRRRLPPWVRPFPNESQGEPAGLDLPHDVSAAVEELTGKRAGDLDRLQVHWLANLPLEVWGPQAHAFYQALGAAGLAVLAPLDNRTEAARLYGQPEAAHPEEDRLGEDHLGEDHLGEGPTLSPPRP